MDALGSSSGTLPMSIQLQLNCQAQAVRNFQAQAVRTRGASESFASVRSSTVGATLSWHSFIVCSACMPPIAGSGLRR
jgi:hypothetical protein